MTPKTLTAVILLTGLCLMSGCSQSTQMASTSAPCPFEELAKCGIEKPEMRKKIEKNSILDRMGYGESFNSTYYAVEDSAREVGDSVSDRLTRSIKYVFPTGDVDVSKQEVHLVQLEF